MLPCYNRGCGQSFDPNNNNDDSCRHHPGAPLFHDAYKVWTCCNKKSVDFTEFLNTKGCTLSKHSNVKPVEPPKKEDTEVQPKPQEVRLPIKGRNAVRPDFNSPLIKITPTVLPALKKAIDGLEESINKKENVNEEKKDTTIGLTCQNRGCSYECSNSPADNEACHYHPGVPIFHEGMKYWSCCQKKTTDFSVFIAQPVCATGVHNFSRDNDSKTEVNCRYDWHQTASNVVVSIFAKLYHYEKSYVQVNPIRLNVLLVFPAQNNTEFKLDLELRGIIKPSATTVQMYGSKVEITMPKAEIESWAKLDFPILKAPPSPQENKELKVADENNSDSDHDLDDIEQISSTARLMTMS